MFCNCNWLRFLATIWPVPPVYPPPPHLPRLPTQRHKKVKRQRKMLNRSSFMNMQRLNNNNNWLTSTHHPSLTLSVSVSCYTSPVSIVCQQNFFWNSNFLTSQKLKTFQTKGCPPSLLPLILPSAFPAKKQSIQSRSSPIKWGSTQHIERKRERVSERGTAQAACQKQQQQQRMKFSVKIEIFCPR